MTDDYLDAFVREGEEHVTELNNALLELEDDPSNEAAMDDIFRIAHTLKGNFAAMGFSDASDLAHALEDLLDEMRDGTVEVTPARMDHVFAAVDEIEACLDEIAANGETSRDVEPVIADLRETIEASDDASRDGDAPGGSDADEDADGDTTDGSDVDEDVDGDAADGSEAAETATESETGPDDEIAAESEDGIGAASDDDSAAGPGDSAAGPDAGDGEREEVARPASAGATDEESDALADFDRDALEAADDRVFVVRVEMDDPEMKAVDAAFVLDAASESYELVGADPSLDAIDDGEYEDGFDLVVAGAADDVETTFAEIQQVADATATEITDAVGAIQSGDESGEATGPAPEAASERTGETGREPADQPASGSEPASGSASTNGSEPSETAAAADATRGDASVSSSDGKSSSGTGAGASGAAETETEAPEIQSVHVDVSQLDELHGLVEQLVTTRIKLRRSVDEDDRRVEEELDELDKITSSLQDTVMDMRLVPLRKIAGKFPRLVRDLAREEDKQVDFVIEGEDVEIDRTILTEISDPLMHLLRNAIDHGVEPPEEREAAGKDPTATVTLRAERDRDRVVIEVSDDGSGIDLERVRSKAVETGIKTPTQIENMDDEEIADLVFHPGFSTNDEVTDVSGRGVGMDVVRDTVTRLDGSVSIDTEPGEGTTFRLTLPVTVAIVKVLFVTSGGEEYGIPIKSVDEISRMREIKHADGEEVVTYDGEVYPLVRLGEALDVPGPTENGDGMLVRIRSAERQVAIHCDGIRGQEEVVVKPFEGILSGIPGLSGAAVLGEGDVVTILDVATL